MYISSGALQIYYRLAFGGPTHSTTTPLLSGNVLLQTITNYNSGTYQLFQNGTPGTLQTDGTVGTLDSTQVSLQVAYDGFPGESYLQGTISELLLFTQVLTSPQRQQIEAYLAQKWGLQQNLPQGHPGTRGIVYPIQRLPNASALPYQVIFSPLQIQPGSCQLWLDGADPAGTGTPPSNGATVSTWVDKSTAKNAAATGSPTYVSGGGINFNGSSYFVNQTFSQNLSKRSIFIIMQETTHSNYFGVFPIIPSPYNASGGDGGEVTGLSIETTNGLTFYGNNGGYNSFIGNSTLLTKSIYNDNMNGTTGSGYFNGSNSANVNAFYTAGTCSGYGIGARWLSGAMNTSYCLNGIIYEIIFYNTPLATPQRLQVEGYLAWKWGLQANLPPTHPYKNVRPGDNVLGISRPANVLPIPPIVCSAISKTTLQTAVFTYRGSLESFAVPSTISPTTITVYMWGAGGGGYYPTQSYGGAGCYLTGILTVTPAETLYVLVGQGGTIQYPSQTGLTTRFGGGGGIISTGGNGNAQYNGSGGGRSAIQRSGTDIVSAGAGGGCGTQAGSGNGHDGGIGSWTGTGGNGANDKYGLGGTQTSGGASQGNGAAGTALVGGRADPWGGGGGGGFFGGGAGSDNNSYGSGGGGGSSYTDLLSSKSGSNGTLNVAPNTASPYYISGVAVGGTQALSGNGGNGLVVITYNA